MRLISSLKTCFSIFDLPVPLRNFSHSIEMRLRGWLFSFREKRGKPGCTFGITQHSASSVKKEKKPMRIEYSGWIKNARLSGKKKKIYERKKKHTRSPSKGEKRDILESAHKNILAKVIWQSNFDLPMMNSSHKGDYHRRTRSNVEANNRSSQNAPDGTLRPRELRRIVL